MPSWFMALAVIFGCCVSGAAAPPTPGAPSNTHEQLFRWYHAQTVGNYYKGGHSNPAWDAYATNALDLYARSCSDSRKRTTNLLQTRYQSASNAMAAGCDDPLVMFIYQIARAEKEGISHEDEVREAIRAANLMQKSKYTTALKFEVEIHPNALMNKYYRSRTTAPPGLDAASRKNYNDAMDLAWKLSGDTKTPVEAVFDALHSLKLMIGAGTNSILWLYEADGNMENHWPTSAYPQFLRGQLSYDYAWMARGRGYMDTVSEEGSRVYVERLRDAKAAFETAWKRDATLPAIANEMMGVEWQLTGSREKMETWFQRAMALDTNYVAPCWNKAFYLLPKWGGTVPEMLNFGRECAASTNWGGQVPWTLIHVHELLFAETREPELKEAYWQKPAVWADVRSVCERYLQARPKDVNHNRHIYIREAKRCERWDVVSQQLQLLTSTNYAFFGGKDEFTKIAEQAASKAPRK